MGPRGVAAIYFTQGANAAAPHLARRHPPQPLPPARIMILLGARGGWLWAQGYNLNCKKIKQFLISSTGAALLRATRLLAFIFISVTSHTRRILLFFYILHSLGVMTSLFMHFALLNRLWKHILFSSPQTPARHGGVKYY